MQPFIDAFVLSSMYRKRTMYRTFSLCAWGKTTWHVDIPASPYPATIGTAVASAAFCWEGWHG